MIDSFRGRWLFLSNFYPVEIEHQGIKYPTVEHYYVAMKIKNDQQINGQFISYMDCREMISKIPADKANMAKNFGKTLKIRKDWDDIRLDTMFWGVQEKFKKDDLIEMLLMTGDEELIEGNNWHDNFFGICNCGPCGGKGLNNLGKILMKIRKNIKENSKTNTLF